MLDRFFGSVAKKGNMSRSQLLLQVGRTAILARGQSGQDLRPFLLEIIIFRQQFVNGDSQASRYFQIVLAGLGHLGRGFARFNVSGAILTENGLYFIYRHVFGLLQLADRNREEGQCLAFCRLGLIIHSSKPPSIEILQPCLIAWSLLLTATKVFSIAVAVDDRVS